MIFDPLYLLMMAPVLLFSFWASSMVKSNFKKYSSFRSKKMVSGAQVARQILDANNLRDVPVQRVAGNLTDHYSPRERVLRLSESVHDSTSIAAIGVAAHEAGHALQHAQGYAVMGLWQTLAKPASLGSNLSYFIIMIGMFMGVMQLAVAGVILFGVVVLFQLVTLPLEFNASSRAKKLIAEYGILDPQEQRGVGKVLNAAAMTYIAAAASSIMTLLYFLIRMGLLGGGDD